MITKIGYEDKTGIQNDEDVPRKNKVMDEDMNEIKQVVNNNADEMTATNTRVENLETGNTENKSDISILEGKVSALETDNSTNKTNIKNLQNDNTTNKSDISALKSDNETNKTDIANIKEKNTTQDTQISTLQTSLNNAKSDITDIKQDITEINEKNNTQDTEITNIKSDIAEINEKDEEQDSKLTELDSKNTEQDTKINDLSEEVESNKAGLINLTASGKSIHVEDSSDGRGKLKVTGNVEQDGEPGPTTPIVPVTVKDEVTVKKMNNNIMQFVESDYISYSEKGIKYTAGSSNGIQVGKFKLKKGQKVKIGFMLFDRPANASFTATNNGTGDSLFSFGNVQDTNSYNLNQIYSKEYTATEDTEIIYKLWFATAPGDFEFQLWAEYENLTEYQRHEEESTTLDIQEEMLTGDDFDEENEVHTWNSVELDNTSNIIVNNNNTTSTEFLTDVLEDIVMNLTATTQKGLLYATHFNTEAGSLHRLNGTTSVGRIRVMIENDVIGVTQEDNNTTKINAFKTWLQAQKTAGTPVKIYYKLTTTRELALTENQKTSLQQLNKLKTYKTVTNIETEENIANLKLDYIADVETYINNKVSNLEQQLNAINELLSTTGTSATLLDNLQNDLESEVK